MTVLGDRAHGTGLTLKERMLPGAPALGVTV